MSNIAKLCNMTPDFENDAPVNGWIVRERFSNDNNKAISLEFGIYVSKDMFMGVPIHHELKKHFIPIPEKSTTPDEYNCYYNHYYMNSSLDKLSVSNFRSKKNGNVIPLLVGDSEQYGYNFIACYAFNIKGKIINLKTNDNVKVLRKIIDKDRRYMYIMAVYTDKQRINPEIVFNITTSKFELISDDGKTNRKCNVTVHDVIFRPGNDITDNVTCEGGASIFNKIISSEYYDEAPNTEFINLVPFINNPTRENAETSNKSNDNTSEHGTRATYPDKKFNGNKPNYNNKPRPNNKMADNKPNNTKSVASDNMANADIADNTWYTAEARNTVSPMTAAFDAANKNK